jgi:hypothetical protein
MSGNPLAPAAYIIVAIGMFAAMISYMTEARAQTEWQDLGGVNGCSLYKRGPCYVLTCGGEGALSCR